MNNLVTYNNQLATKCGADDATICAGWETKAGRTIQQYALDGGAISNITRPALAFVVAIVVLINVSLH